MQRFAALGAVLLLSTACQELQVENLNEPDRLLALAQAGDLESLLGSTFPGWFDMLNNGIAAYGNPMDVIGVTGSTTSGVGSGTTEVAEEPRRPFRSEDAPGGPARLIGSLWRAAHQTTSNANDYLRTAEELGFTFKEAGQDVTQRHRAYAKLMQGIGWGFQSLIFDIAVVTPESEPLSADIKAQSEKNLKTWQEGITVAVASLDEAIAIAKANPFPAFPSQAQSRLWFGTPQTMSNAQFQQLANTLAARFLIQGARSPADRAKLDWNRILNYTANGLKTDFEVVLAPGVRRSDYLARIQNNSPGCIGPSCMRLRYQLLGMADISGAYQTWLNTPIINKTRFDIVTPDRRITGPTPQSPGAYVTWWADNLGYDSGYGNYHRSAYQWRRHIHEGFAVNSGTMKQATVDENNLYRAEALIHLGRMQEAADLINISRTRSHRLPDGVTYPGLPPVTAAGVPQSADCVPRTDAGACGDLLVALRYERMLELIGLDTVRGHTDARGFGMLIEGTLVHFPVLSNDMQAMGLYEKFGGTSYTFGGVGAPGGATYNPVTLANFK
jgi:hypothetical protein